MTTFDALSHIRREALSPADALKFLVEHFGFTVTYARELITATYKMDRSPRLPCSGRPSGDT